MTHNIFTSEHLSEKEQHLRTVRKQLRTLTTKLALKQIRLDQLHLLTDTSHLLEDRYLQEEIYAIFPIAVDTSLYSLAVTESGVFYIARSPLSIINELSLVTNHCLFEPYARKGIALTLEPGHRNIPYANCHYSLMPFGRYDRPDTFWLNPALIDGCITEGESVYVDLAFGLLLEIPVTEAALISRMTTSLVLQGLYARRELFRFPREKESLHVFLNIRSSPLIVKALQGLKVSDLPGKNDSLHKNMFAVYMELTDRTAC